MPATLPQTQTSPRLAVVVAGVSLVPLVPLVQLMIARRPRVRRSGVMTGPPLPILFAAAAAGAAFVAWRRRRDRESELLTRELEEDEHACLLVAAGEASMASGDYLTLPELRKALADRHTS